MCVCVLELNFNRCKTNQKPTLSSVGATKWQLETWPNKQKKIRTTDRILTQYSLQLTTHAYESFSNQINTIEEWCYTVVSSSDKSKIRREKRFGDRHSPWLIFFIFFTLHLFFPNSLPNQIIAFSCALMISENVQPNKAITNEKRNANAIHHCWWLRWIHSLFCSHLIFKSLDQTMYISSSVH